MEYNWMLMMIHAIATLSKMGFSTICRKNFAGFRDLKKIGSYHDMIRERERGREEERGSINSIIFH